MKIFICTSLFVFFIPTIVFGALHLDDTIIGQKMNVSGDNSKVNMKDVNETLSELPPEEISKHIDMETASGKRFLQILIENEPEEKYLFVQIMLIAIKLEQLGWSVHKIAETFYSDAIFIDGLAANYPRMYKILEVLKNYEGQEIASTQHSTTLDILESLPIAGAKGVVGALVGFAGGIIVEIAAHIVALGFIPGLLPILNEAAPYVLAVTTSIGATAGISHTAQKIKEKKRNVMKEEIQSANVCEQIFSNFLLQHPAIISD